MTSKSATPGDLLKLRKDVLPEQKVRKWIVLGKDNGRIILISYKPKGNALEVVKEDDIDWEEYLKRYGSVMTCPSYGNNFARRDSS